MPDDLTPKQFLVLSFIEKELKNDRPFPSLAQISKAFGFTRNAAKQHVDALEKKGKVGKREQRVSNFYLENQSPMNSFELVASIAAGSPNHSEEEKDRFVSFTPHFFSEGEIKALKVDGESMQGDLIGDGDLALVRLQDRVGKHDVVAVNVEGEGITLKRVRRRGPEVDLLPSNPDFPIRSFPAEAVKVIGKLVGIVRRTT